MSLTSYRAAPPRGKLGGQSGGQSKGVKKGQLNLNERILLADLATTYSPAP